MTSESKSRGPPEKISRHVNLLAMDSLTRDSVTWKPTTATGAEDIVCVSEGETVEIMGE